MKRIPASGFNKEKLVFLGTTTVLALTLYHLLISAPVALEPTPPVSNVAPPGPLDREKQDTRVANVLYYISGGVNPQMGVAVDRSRKNPFEPIDEWKNERDVVDHGPPKPKPVAVAGPPPPPEVPEPTKGPDPKNSFGPRADKVAKVDFSGVMTLGGVTNGLLKSKDGQTIQVKEGDYLEDYKYTVVKIEKQAIWVSDEDNQMFVARDTSFDESGASSGGDGEDKPAKKKAPKGGKKDLVPANDSPPPSPQPVASNQNNQNNQNNPNNQNNQNNQRNPNNQRNNSKGNRGGGGGGGGGGRPQGNNSGGQNFRNNNNNGF